MLWFMWFIVGFMLAYALVSSILVKYHTKLTKRVNKTDDEETAEQKKTLKKHAIFCVVWGSILAIALLIAQAMAS